MFSPMLFMPGDVLLTLDYNNISDATAPTSANCQFNMLNDGTLQWDNTDTMTLADWIHPKGNYLNYDVQSVITAGSLTTDPSAGTWLAMTSARSWALLRTTNGTSTCTMTLNLRRTGTTTTLKSGTVTFSAARHV